MTVSADRLTIWRPQAAPVRGHRGTWDRPRDTPLRTSAVAVPAVLAWLCPCGRTVGAGQSAWLLPDGRYRCGPCTPGA